MPVLSIGKDVNCDNGVFIDAIQSQPVFAEKALHTTPADAACEAFGYRIFWTEIVLASKELITPELAQDRASVAPVYSQSDFADLRPGALSEWRSILDTIENEFLTSDGPFIGGAQTCAVADIHVRSPLLASASHLTIADAQPGDLARKARFADPRSRVRARIQQT